MAANTHRADTPRTDTEDRQTGEGGTAFIFRDARLLLVEAEVSATAARRLVPPQLDLAEPAIATFFFADYPSTAFGSIYQEAGVLVHGRDHEGDLLHCCWIVVDDPTGLILGRELYGFPKKMAEVDFRITEERAGGVVQRDGAEVLRIDAVLGEPVEEPEPVFARRCVNAIGSPITGMRLIEASTEERIRSEHRATATLSTGAGPRDDLASLAPGEVRSGRLVKVDYGAGDSLPRLSGEVDPGWMMSNYWARAL